MTMLYRPDGPVVPAAQMDAIREAGVLVESRREALRAERDRIDEARRDAARLGREEGYKAGLAAAAADLADLARQQESILSRLDDRLNGLVLEAVTEVIGETPPLERVRRAVRRVLDEVRQSAEVRVSVAADDYTAFSKLLAVAAAERRLQPPPVDMDPLLRKGEVVMVSAAGRRHIGVAERLSRLADLLGDRP